MNEIAEVNENERITLKTRVIVMFLTAVAYVVLIAAVSYYSLVESPSSNYVTEGPATAFARWIIRVYSAPGTFVVWIIKMLKRRQIK